MIIFLFFIFLLFLSEINSYKISFKKFIKKKTLETNYSGENDTIEILNNIQKSAIQIKKILSLSYLENINLESNNLNVHQEKQKKIDLLSNSIIKNAIYSHNVVNTLCSEEEYQEKIINIKSNKKLIFVYDPLDGSSNIENSMPMGTIFGLYKDSLNFDNTLTSINKSNDLILSGYILYSSSMHLVFYFEYNVYHFIYDDDLKDFILHNDNVKIPEYGNIYSINEAKINNFHINHKLYLEELKNKDYSSRYYGCLVADFHNILINGGIFMYPKDIKNDKNKIRLLYEAKPLAKLLDFSGGLCFDDFNDINKKVIKNIHETTSIYFGSKKNMEDFYYFCNNLEKK
tara:strand:+ start:7732 stop:8763 length:1032 start_codon:yes stop_codon:yes gene_type:complete